MFSFLHLLPPPHRRTVSVGSRMTVKMSTLAFVVYTYEVMSFSGSSLRRDVLQLTKDLLEGGTINPPTFVL